MFLTCFKINCDAFHYTWPIIQLLFGQMAHPILETLKMEVRNFFLENAKNAHRISSIQVYKYLVKMIFEQ